MKKYRKKPVVIEAIQFTASNFDAVCDFMGETPEMKINPNFGVDENGNTNEPYLGIYINTLEGKMYAVHGDYIIKGVNGEFYPCKADIFLKTYEPADIIRPRFMTFGQALHEVKEGNLVTRKGWNGKGMFIFMRPADELPIAFVANNIKSLPQKVKDYYRQDCIDESGNDISMNMPQDDVVKFTAYLCMKAADGMIVNGWLASQTDMLSEDWMIFE